MSHFLFRLDALLRVKRTLAQHEETQLGRLLAQRAKLTGRLAELEQAREQYARNMQSLAGTTGAELALASAVLSCYHHNARRIEFEVARLNKAVETQRVRYIEAQREQEMVEQLRKRAFSSWQQESNRREQKAADELFLLRRGDPSIA